MVITAQTPRSRELLFAPPGGEKAIDIMLMRPGAEERAIGERPAVGGEEIGGWFQLKVGVSG